MPLQGEPFADEALSFTRLSFLQRDVEVEVETMDKVGTFLGSVTLPGPRPVSLGLALLREGLAKLQPFFDYESKPGGRELKAAEDAAKAARLKVSPQPRGPRRSPDVVDPYV